LQILSDDEKRPLYDRYGEAGLKGAGTAAAAQGAAGYAGVHINRQNFVFFAAVPNLFFSAEEIVIGGGNF